MEPNANQIGGYLIDLFEGMASLETIEMARSSISVTVPKVNGVSVGQVEVISRLLRSFRFKRPKKARYDDIWDVQLVYDVLNSWADNSQLDLMQLSAKLVMLLLLGSMRRVNDLVKLQYSSVQITEEGLTGSILRPKEAKTGRHQTARMVCRKRTEPKLDVVQCWREYERRMKKRRVSSGEATLLITVKPFRPASADTIRRWIKEIFRHANLPPRFKPHSVRVAALTQRILEGTPLEQAIKGTWTSSQVARRHYDRSMAVVGRKSTEPPQMAAQDKGMVAKRKHKLDHSGTEGLGINQGGQSVRKKPRRQSQVEIGDQQKQGSVVRICELTSM